MIGFVDVLLRGLALVAMSVALGGIAWVVVVLRAEPLVKPDRATARALRLVAAGACGAAAAQAAVMLVGLGALAPAHGGWPLAAYLETTFARVGSARVLLGVALGGLAWWLARHPAGRAAWATLVLGGLGLVGSSAALSHAIARVEDRGLLLALDALHQLAAATWVGGLAHLTAHAVGTRGEPGLDRDPRDEPRVLRRFSTLAFTSVVVLVLSGGGLTWLFVREPAALIGTAYGVMVLSKVALLGLIVSLAAVNFRMARDPEPSGPRVARLVEAELGLAVTVLFAAASLTSLPPAVDVPLGDRASPADVGARFVPAAPRMTSPPVGELIRQADPLMQPTGRRLPVERAWSEYNHHWAGLFVLLMSVLAVLERLGVRGARHWPLLFLGLAVFVLLRSDPRAWPLGPTGFWESLTLPDVLQHRAFALLVAAFGVFEWMVRTARLRPHPWALVFPLLFAVGGALLLTHSHAMFGLKDEFLTEVTHAPLGLLGAAAGWARWLELRVPGGDRGAAWVWRGCMMATGVLLLVYREA
jgi:putative copper resistance protein D